MRFFCIALAVAAFFAASVAQAQERDGKQWSSWNEGNKYVYVTGLLDGVTTGADFSDPVLSRGSVVLYKPDKACEEKTRTTYEYNTSRYMFGLTLRDFVEGLDTFYTVRENQYIPVNKAVRVIAMQRKSVPEAAQILDDLRKQYSEPN